MPSLCDLYQSSFRIKLLTAKKLYQENGNSLRADVLVCQGLAALELKAQELQEQMAALKLAPLCISCSVKPGGGCCSLFMADENDAVLLLINLLAGLTIDIQKDDGFECYLLGARGCILRFKPMFCLNYNCHAIKTHTNAAALSSYMAATGELLQSQWQLETLILAYLRRCSSQRLK